MARILVLGGRGYYGQQVVAALADSSHEVAVASRRSGPYRLDLADPGTFEVLLGFTLVINATDSINAPPDALASWCLANGVTWLEMAADLPTIERLLALPSDDARGRLVIGVGIFPGLSTALARQAWDAADRPTAVLLGIRLSPLSAAGRGTVEIMTAILQTPSVRWRDGERIVGPPVGEVLHTHFHGTGVAPALVIALPDAALIRRCTNAPTVTATMSVVPGFLRFNFKVASWLITRSGPLRPFFAWLSTASLRVLRGALLRGRGTAVQLTAAVKQADGLSTRRALRAPDGTAATAVGAAAAALLWLELPDVPSPGVHVAADVLDCDRWIARIQELGCVIERPL